MSHFGGTRSPGAFRSPSAAAFCAAIALLLGVTPSRAVSAEDSPSADVIQKLLGPEKRIRDLASFTTEKGEPGTLVLYLTKVDAFDAAQEDVIGPLPPSCPQQVEGIPLRGAYSVALIVGGRLVNELPIPAPPGSEDGSMALPVRNLPYYNHIHWGQGPEVRLDPEVRHTEPTKLLRLADYNGDGQAWEFRLLQPGGACEHVDMLVAGYSAARHAAVIFPVVAGPIRSEWSDNFFPEPAAGAGKKIERNFACDDRNEHEIWQEYLYDADREAWIMTRHRQRDCAAEVAQVAQVAKSASETPEPLPSPVTLAVASAEVKPGESVSVQVTVDTHDTPIARIAHSIVVDPRISVAAIEGLDFSVASGVWTAADDGIGPVDCASELVDSCQWAFSMRLDGDFRGHAVLYQLELKIPPDVPPGTYRLANTHVSASAQSGKRVSVDGQDGQLVVKAK